MDWTSAINFYIEIFWQIINETKSSSNKEL